MPMDNETRTQWNADNYKQIKVYVSPDLAAKFKAGCTVASVSMASVLSQFMADYCSEIQAKDPKPPTPDFSTRGKRRMFVRRMIEQLEAIKEAEENYRDNIPENLQGGQAYEAAEQAIEQMGNALDSLNEAF
jgi:hypothetical protein